jgi:hypothetical protein
MKKILLPLVASLCLLLSGCSKPEKETPAPVPVMEFTINGASDVTYKFEKTILPLTLNLISGPQEKLDLTLSGLPAGMKGNFGSASGTPSFSTTLEFTHSGLIAAGTYPLQIIATGTSGKIKTVGMNLNVVNDCGKPMLGKYTGEMYEDGKLTGTFSNCTVTIKADNPNRIYLDTGGGDPLSIDLNCSTQSLSIAPADKFTYTGTFNTTPAYLEIQETSASGTMIYKFSHL